MTRPLPVVVLTLLTAACGGPAMPPGGARSQGSATPGLVSPPAAEDGLVTEGYADPGSCAACHVDLAKSYASVAMARSFGRPEAIPIIEDYEQRNRLTHAPSRFTYEMRREGNRFLQRRSESGAGGAPGATFEREVTFVIGSGRHARTYLHLEPGGVLTEMPVTWYTQEGSWGMSPGYDQADQADFFRPVTYMCLFCHDAYPPLPRARDGAILPQIVPTDLPSGIDCQRCHGPGARHVLLARAKSSSFADVRASIVNPARLSRDRQMDVCMQCHLETTSSAAWSGLVAFGRGVFSFRPGEPLAAYRTHFDHPPGSGHDDKFEIAHQAYRLRQSACFRRSAMTCTTCHDPHRRPADPAAYYSSKCLGCHAVRQCGPAARAAATRGGAVDCIACHMPPRRTEDVVHVVMTDHLIRRIQPPDPVRLAPRREAVDRYAGPIVFYSPEEIPSGAARDLILGVASLLDDVDRGPGLALVQRSLAAREPAAPEARFQLGLTLLSMGRARDAVTALQRAAALAPGNPRILLALGGAFEADGHDDEALGAYTRALAVRPDDPEAHTNAGGVLARQGRLQEALAHFDSAVGTGDALALGNRGAVLARLGRDREAEADLREALRIRPGLPEACLALATLLLSRGDPPDARGVLEVGVLRNPAHTALLARAAWVLSTSARPGVRDGRKAVDYATRAVSLSKRGDPRALDALAAALAETGRAAEASRVAAEARNVAAASGQKGLAEAIDSRRRIYEEGRPYRDGTGGAAAPKNGGGS